MICVGDVLPAGQKWPAAHAPVHVAAVSPVAAPYRPAAHALQAVALVVGLHWPAGQTAHATPAPDHVYDLEMTHTGQETQPLVGEFFRVQEAAVAAPLTKWPALHVSAQPPKLHVFEHEQKKQLQQPGSHSPGEFHDPRASEGEHDACAAASSAAPSRTARARIRGARSAALHAGTRAVG